MNRFHFGIIFTISVLPLIVSAQLNNATDIPVKCDRIIGREVYKCTYKKAGGEEESWEYEGADFKFIDDALAKGLVAAYSIEKKEIVFVKPREIIPSSSRVDVGKNTRGSAGNGDFIVDAPSQGLADKILALVEKNQDRIARKWTDKSVKALYPCIIKVDIKVDKKTEFSTANPNFKILDKRYYLMKLLINSLEDMQMSDLNHELAHTTLYSAFPDSLPRWVLEATATFEDDEKKEINRDYVITWAKINRWPSLKNILLWNHETASLMFEASDYAASYSFTQFLLTLDPSEAYLKRYFDFAQATNRAKTKADIDAAVREYYGFSAKNLDEIEKQWHAWVKQEYGLK